MTAGTIRISRKKGCLVYPLAKFWRATVICGSYQLKESERFKFYCCGAIVLFCNDLVSILL